MNENQYLTDAQGRMVPLQNVKEQDKLEDEMVKGLLAQARRISATLAQFKSHAFAECNSFVDILAMEYGAQRGGTKGNMSFTTYDGRAKVQIAMSDHIVFGPELQVAKSLIDECLNNWSADANANLRTVIYDAFSVNQHGKIDKQRVLGLRRMDIKDETWRRAMQAISDSCRSIGTTRYVRLYERDSQHGAWRQIPLDIASIRDDQVDDDVPTG